MPVKNGRIYIDKSKTPNVGISAHDIARCLGVGTLDIGKQCTHDKVNMFSIKKPVEINQREPNRAIEWWKGTEGNCGIAAPTRVSSFTSLLAQYDGGMNGWRRVKPVTWNRYNDFDGYYHYAQPPITEIDSQDSYFKLNGELVNVNISYNGDDVDSSGSGSLKMSDFIIDNLSLDKWYMGVVIMDETGSDWIGFVANQQGANIESIDFPMNMLVVGKSYIVVPFYSKTAFNVSYADGDKTIMALPIVQPVKFRVRDAKELLSIGAEASWSSDNATVTFTVDIQNNGTGPRAVGPATARLMVLRDNLQSADDYWAANPSEGDYDIDLGITNIPQEGVSVTKTQAVLKDKAYVLLVRLYSAGINFDYGPEFISPEIEVS